MADIIGSNREDLHLDRQVQKAIVITETEAQNIAGYDRQDLYVGREVIKIILPEGTGGGGEGTVGPEGPQGPIGPAGPTPDVSEFATKPEVKSAMDRADEAFTQAVDGKTLVATAVTAKGVSASPSDAFSQLAVKIGQIEGGEGGNTGLAAAIRDDAHRSLQNNNMLSDNVTAPTTTDSVSIKMIETIVEDFEGETFLFTPIQGAIPWELSTTNFKSGTRSYKSGPAPHGGRSSFKFDFEAEGIGFSYSTSSEQGYDWLRVYLDDVLIVSEAGYGSGPGQSKDWKTFSIATPTGIHTIEFRFEKDGSGSNGTDSVWIDDLIFMQ